MRYDPGDMQWQTLHSNLGHPLCTKPKCISFLLLLNKAPQVQRGLNQQLFICFCWCGLVVWTFSARTVFFCCAWSYSHICGQWAWWQADWLHLRVCPLPGSVGLSAWVLPHVAASAASSGFLTSWPPKGKEQKQQGLPRPRLKRAGTSLSLRFIEQSLSHGQLRFKEVRKSVHLLKRKTPKSSCEESCVPGWPELLWLTLWTHHTKWSYVWTWLDKLSCS